MIDRRRGRSRGRAIVSGPPRPSRAIGLLLGSLPYVYCGKWTRRDGDRSILLRFVSLSGRASSLRSAKITALGLINAIRAIWVLIFFSKVRYGCRYCCGFDGTMLLKVSTCDREFIGKRVLGSMCRARCLEMLFEIREMFELNFFKYVFVSYRYRVIYNGCDLFKSIVVFANGNLWC